MIGALVLALEWDGVRAYELLQVKGRLNMLDFRMLAYRMAILHFRSTIEPVLSCPTTHLQAGLRSRNSDNRRRSRVKRITFLA
ncbi:MAG: hypothetical protein FRX48_05380 [Lasallia pustulata]|uniref:Uncharacterized protein n=1 Tax=Lasallia pustulata TaxID=136370 RepID=A0A5M8PNI7_9LECA|nr:MAG: hypothetical protein FRX48_05380 [Lasallia pustulata]